MTAIQTKVLCSTASMTTAARTTSVSFDPLGSDDIGYVVVRIKQTGTTAVTRPTSSSFVEIQGSLDNSSWAVLARLDISTTPSPADFFFPEATVFGASNTGAYLSSVATMQLMPWMRVSYPALANADITVTVAEA